ncbi:hypothetical protein [uncultured Roseobacter sp.]|uniref:hypothetical protein n=1 Tax=uncultured Roseobacter sp. TaxID=114847 RepID=UPI00262BE60B|nr:hypothetical protein [uncultured Roseobacter sp.]
MGVLSFVDVFDVRDIEFGTSRPVGKLEKVMLTSATRVLNTDSDQEGYGAFLYGEEIPLQFIDITRMAEAPGVAVRRQEFKILPGDDTKDIVPGTHLVVAQSPHSSYWAAMSPLRPHRRERPALLDDASELAQLKAGIAKSPRDLFETRKGVLTAAVEEDDFRVFLRPSVRAQYRQLSHVIGYVDGSDGPIEKLNAVEMEIMNSKRLKATLAAVARGAPVGPNRSLSVPKRLRDDLEGLMLFSVRQALAGPGAEAEPETYVGKPVGLYARHLFMDHAHNAARQADETGDQLMVEQDALERGDYVQRQLARYLSELYA